MKVYTSYFYKIRFFEPHMIPFSTAMYDPRWFHEGKSSLRSFKDKRGVYNGLRLTQFAPDESCHGLCNGKGCSDNPETCAFLKAYRAQLDRLDFDALMDKLERVVSLFRGADHIHNEPIIVLIVHEAPDNPCSERKVIQEWFRDHGVLVEELDIDKYHESEKEKILSKLGRESSSDDEL